MDTPRAGREAAERSPATGSGTTGGGPRGHDSGWRKALGAHGEQVGATFLGMRGMAILDRNWRCAIGELDIVAQDAETVVFVEVKTRRSSEFGGAGQAVTWRKLQRLRRLGAAWLAAHPQVHPPAIRIDVLAVTQPPRGAAQVEHLVGVG